VFEVGSGSRGRLTFVTAELLVVLIFFLDVNLELGTVCHFLILELLGVLCLIRM
jgi:hypothetical protein